MAIESVRGMKEGVVIHRDGGDNFLIGVIYDDKAGKPVLQTWEIDAAGRPRIKHEIESGTDNKI